jgi:hypothetical protein
MFTNGFSWAGTYSPNGRTGHPQNRTALTQCHGRLP